MSIDDSTQPAAPDDPLGILDWIIGEKFKVDSYLGGGGFGEVYGGHNVNLPEQRVVIKFFKRVLTRDKFAKEARILCMLDHPNICRVIDFLQEEAALVVAFIDGVDGSRILKDSGVLPERLFLSVAGSITSAIAYAHERSIAHRDIKPANIMVDKNDHAYLIDFGIAKQLGGEATRTGYQALTPMFAAPERQQGDVDYNPYLSDIYELGVSLFTFCTNTMPYRNPINPILEEWGGPAADALSPQLKTILKKATHPDPAHRYKKAGAMAEDLKKLQSVYSKGHRKGKLIAIPIVLAAIVGGYFGWQALQGGGSEPESARTTRTTTETPSGETTSSSAGIMPDTGLTDTSAGGVSGVLDSSGVQITPSDTETVEPEPPPPPEPVLRIAVNPSELVELHVDGQRRTVGRFFETTRGTHEVELVHAGYPVHRASVRVSGDSTNQAIDLVREYAEADSVSLQLAMIPPSDELMLELSFNGYRRPFTSFPVFDLVKLSGVWRVEAAVYPLNNPQGDDLVVDSCVTFPFGGGPHVVLQGNSGQMAIESQGSGMTVIPFAIYWSDR